MRAAVLVSKNKIEIMNFLDFPLVQAGQVLVKMSYAGICGAQLREFTGAKGEDKYLPHMLGHEGSGEVVFVGPHVVKVCEGDNVILHWRKGSGMEATPAQWVSDEGISVGSGPVTCFSDYTIVSENRVTKIPATFEEGEDNFPLRMDVCALLGCAISTGIGIINNEARLKVGQSVLVIGGGGVGMSVVQAASLCGAGLIAVWERAEEKFPLLQSLGADQVGAPKYSRNGYDVVVDTVGSPVLIAMGLEEVKPGGKLILVGQPVHNLPLTFPNFSSHYQGKHILDSQGGLTNPDEDLPRYVWMMARGKADFSRLISKTITLDQLPEIMEFLRLGRVVGRCLIRF